MNTEVVSENGRRAEGSGQKDGKDAHFEVSTYKYRARGFGA